MKLLRIQIGHEMNNNETAQIVDFIAAADSRNVTPQTYGAWHLVIGHLSFETARQAAVMALQDEAIRWTEPKHILSKAGRLLEVAEQDKRRQLALTREEPSTGAEMPVCIHGVGLLYCGPCCHEAAIVAELISPRVYKKKLLV